MWKEDERASRGVELARDKFLYDWIGRSVVFNVKIDKKPMACLMFVTILQQSDING